MESAQNDEILAVYQKSRITVAPYGRGSEGSWKVPKIMEFVDAVRRLWAIFEEKVIEDWGTQWPEKRM